VKMFDADKTRMIGLPYGKKNCDDMLSRFHLIQERHRRTDEQADGRTDRFAVSISRVSVLTRDNNGKFDPSNLYKMAKDIKTSPRIIYDYVVELRCCAKSEQNRPTQFCWGNRGSLSFFTHTQSVNQSIN